jgi:acylglycerol lipase
VLGLITAPMLAPAGELLPDEEEPNEPDPATFEHDTAELIGTRGVGLHTQAWRPCGPARGVVVMTHGLNDHGGRFADFAERLVARGFSVHAFDLRGHGRSGGPRGWVDSFDDYVDDLDVVARHAAVRERFRPVFVFGQGMGGTIAALWTLARRPPVAGLLLSGARLQAHRAARDAPALRLLAAVAPRTRTLQVDVRRSSRDRRTIEDMIRDPLVQRAAVPVRTVRELLDAVARVDELAPSLKVSLLAMHGSADELEDPKGTRRLVSRAASGDKQLYLYEGLAHDLIHEPERARVVRDVSAWLCDRTRV